MVARLMPLALVAVLLLSGCAGSKDPVEQTSPLPAETSASDAATPTPTTEEFVPKFHTHDYWGGRPSMVLFDKPDVQIGQDALSETTFSPNAIIIGSTTFDTKLDGEDVNTADKTDVVFQGTEKIDVTITWTDTNAVPGLNFYYKPANTPTFTLLGPMTPGETKTLYLTTGMADMPHQLSLTRWKFKLEAFNPQTAAFPVTTSYARGSVGVKMVIFDGGDQFIDPPHPYFFQEGPQRFAGEMNQTFANCVLVNNTRVNENQPTTSPVAYGCKLDDYRAEAPHIVPWETTKLVAHLWYNHTGQSGTAPHALGLKFHGSDSPEYRFPKAAETSAGYARYEIEVTESMTDSPYATQSDWRFGIYPIIADQRDAGGDFTGDIHISLTAINEGASGRGMGN